MPESLRRGLTPCRSAASPLHERFIDVTPISLRRDRPLQRLVRQRRRPSPARGGRSNGLQKEIMGSRRKARSRSPLDSPASFPLAMRSALGGRVALTVSAVKAAARPSSGCYYLMDTNLPGFGIRDYPTKTTYVVGRQRIGEAAIMPFHQAKEIARKTLLRREVARQANLDSFFVEQARHHLEPHQFELIQQAALDAYSQIAEMAPDALRVAERTMRDLFERLRDEVESDPDRNQLTVKRELAVWQNHILPFEVKLPSGETRPLEKVRVRAVSQDHVVALKKHLLQHPFTANKALALLHRGFVRTAAWQPAWRLASTNPVAGVTHYDMHPRDRTVHEDEFALLFKSIGEFRAEGRGEPWLSVMEFNLLNGVRPGEPFRGRSPLGRALWPSSCASPAGLTTRTSLRVAGRASPATTPTSSGGGRRSAIAPGFLPRWCRTVPATASRRKLTRRRCRSPWPRT
jgi:hypothetical protein